MSLRRYAAGAVALAFAATGLVACGNDDSGEPLAEGDTIRIGTTDREKEAWTVFERLANEEGIDLEVVEFSEYPPVNTALSEGDLDVNLFQHIKYLAQYNVAPTRTWSRSVPPRSFRSRCSGPAAIPWRTSRTAPRWSSPTTPPTRAAP